MANRGNNHLGPSPFLRFRRQNSQLTCDTESSKVSSRNSSPLSSDMSDGSKKSPGTSPKNFAFQDRVSDDSDSEENIHFIPESSKNNNPYVGPSNLCTKAKLDKDKNQKWKYDSFHQTFSQAKTKPIYNRFTFGILFVFAMYIYTCQHSFSDLLQSTYKIFSRSGSARSMATNPIARIQMNGSSSSNSGSIEGFRSNSEEIQHLTTQIISLASELGQYRQKSQTFEAKEADLKEQLAVEEADLADMLKMVEEGSAENARLKSELEEARKVISKSEERNLRGQHSEQTLEELRTEIKNIKGDIQRHSSIEVKEKYGNGPHRIQIDLKFPDVSSASVDSESRNFIIELAPLELMPHSINLFLDQVRAKLIDGCSFYRNANHIIQAGPQDSNRTEEFKKLNMDKLSFQEYTEEFKHKQYTIGFAGRPTGGLNFYINMRDNTEIHGLGGQAGKVGSVEAEPCFGKIVKGFEVVDMIHAMPVKADGSNMDLLVDSIKIEKATIL